MPAVPRHGAAEVDAEAIAPVTTGRTYRPPSTATGSPPVEGSKSAPPKRSPLTVAVREYRTTKDAVLGSSSRSIPAGEYLCRNSPATATPLPRSEHAGERLLHNGRRVAGRRCASLARRTGLPDVQRHVSDGSETTAEEHQSSQRPGDRRRGNYGARLKRNTSKLPAFVSGPLPKSTAASNDPVTSTLPLVPTATAFPVSM